MSGQSVLDVARRVSLEDRYSLAEGEVFLTGVQACVRVLIDQHRADAAAGLRTATLASGYPGSPLAGLDRELERLGPLGAEHDIVLRRAVNEELAATAVYGSQLANTLPGPRFDGVVGVWFGKAPGLDRATDAIRHGNHLGTDRRGGVLALVGDDPGCVSSTVPSASERLLAALHVPTFVPGSVQEVLDLGRHAIACSRASGLWSALKVVTNVADAAATAQVGAGRVAPQQPLLEWEGAPFVHTPSPTLLPPYVVEMERTMVGPRTELARLYGRLNALNRVVRDDPGARVGVVAAGTALHDTLAALGELGGAARVLQIAMLSPLDAEVVRGFAAGLEEIVVIEEKGPFLELLVRDALYGAAERPPVLGAHDDRGAPLVPAHGALDVDAIARVLGARLLAHGESGVRAALERLDAVAARPAVELGAQRTPFFCSGCPHNTSLVTADDEVVGAGIGCHTMVMLAGAGHGRVSGMTQMGSEGAQWIGAAPFVDVPHFTQNLGDGTFHHSGSLAVRAAVAADLDITFKLLANGYVSMTGGQQIPGGMPVEAIARSLAAEGVRRIVITSDDPHRFTRAELPAIATVRPRADVMRVQEELAATPGVTVMIHDQACAAELRRERKRGRAPDPAMRVLINERVCEGCGDCGERSGCLSVEPVETEFGRKTRINQTSCNRDYSCLAGDCPSFVTYDAPAASPRAAAGAPDVDLPAPAAAPGPEARIRLVGIGGTGVVTVNQVLGMAALLDGRHAGGLDQTGLSQKAGPVTSDLRLSASAVTDGAVVPAGDADLLLGFDLLGAAAPGALRVADPVRTLAVVSTALAPTGEMVVDARASAPDPHAARAAIDAVTRAADNVYLDAHGLCEQLFGDATAANVLLLGAAWQAGTIPLSLAAIEEAFRLNGVAVERNLAAFAWGRVAVARPAALPAGAPAPVVGTPDRIREQVAAVEPGEGPLRRTLELRAADLLGWGGPRAVGAYLASVARVREAERARTGESAVTEAFAQGLHKLTAYKDEYEVARLHLEGLRELPAGARPTFHLHPPLLRALGMRRKLRLGPWFIPVFRLLRRGRVLRGTAFDPFGHSEVRRVERALPGEYTSHVEAALARLDERTAPLVLEIAQLPDLVRGYEQIKLAGVVRFRERAAELEAALAQSAGR
jgi:indolepyruvate ferredoxin oxidoreductase